MHRMRGVGVLVVLVLLAAGCGAKGLTRSGDRTFGSTASPDATERVGSGVTIPTATPTPGGATPTKEPPSVFTLRLTDTHGLHPAGIEVRVTGPVTQVTKSDAKG
jgi:hypothetical protein